MARYTGKPGSASVAIQEIARIDSRYTNRCLYNTPGCSTFTVPGGVNSVLAVAVGPGSKPCEGLKCARLMSYAAITATLAQTFGLCCCTTCIGNCCYPVCCGQSNTANCSAGGWRPVHTVRCLCQTITTFPFSSKGYLIWNSSGCLCYNDMTFCHLSWGDYVYEKILGGMGGGYAEKTISVTPSQNLDVVVGCWNCATSFSSVTANSTVSICATGPKLCRSCIPVVNGPYRLGNVDNHLCHLESLLHSSTITQTGYCGVCKCCGCDRKTFSATTTWGWVNDFQQCFVAGCGYGGDINRVGGGEVIRICKAVSQTGQDHSHCFMYCGNYTNCRARCYCCNTDIIGCGAVGLNGPIPGHPGSPACFTYERVMRAHTAGCYALSCCPAPTGTSNYYCESPSALTTCHHQFISVHPLHGSESLPWQQCRCPAFFFGGGCAPLGVGVQNDYENCIANYCTYAVCLGSFHKTAPCTTSGTCVGTINQCQANTPGYLNIFSLCNCFCLCCWNQCYSKLRFQMKDAAYSKAGSRSHATCVCGGEFRGADSMPNSKLILSNESAVAANIYKLGGSSAGNYYSNGVASTSDATYSPSASYTYNCAGSSGSYQNLNDNSAAFICTDYRCISSSEQPCRWYYNSKVALVSCRCDREGYFANNFTVANGESLKNNVVYNCVCGNACATCSAEFAYMPHYHPPISAGAGIQVCGCFKFEGFYAPTGGCVRTWNFPGHIYAPHKQGQTVRGFESTKAPCCHDRFSCCHAGDEIMCGYEFFMDCICCDNFAVKQNLFWPTTLSSGGGYSHPFHNDLTMLKGDIGVVTSTNKLYPGHCSQRHNYFCDNLPLASQNLTCGYYSFYPANGYCACIGNCSTQKLIPPITRYKYYANTVYTGHPVRCTISTCCSTATTRHDLSSIVAVMKNGPLCNSGQPTIYGPTCVYQNNSFQNFGMCGGVWNEDVQFCMRAFHRVCQGTGSGSYHCVNLYWPHCLGYNALTANTNDSFHNCTGVSCGKNYNPLQSVFDHICFYQSFKGLDDNGKPCMGMASAMSNGYANAQVYLDADSRSFCKEFMGPNFMPYSHRTIPFLTRGFCQWTNDCYLSNTAVCSFRTPDKITICDSDYYYQFVHDVEYDYNWCASICNPSVCYCCGCCSVHAYMFQKAPQSIVRTPTGGVAASISSDNAQGGAGTATPGNWSSTIGGTGGSITNVAVSTKGTGYKTTPFICVSGGGGGTGAVLEPVMHFIANNDVCCVGTTGLAPGVGFDTGCMVGVKVVCGGSGYTCAPTLTVCGGGTSSANPITHATLSATVSAFNANKSFGSGGGSVAGQGPTDISVTDTAALVSVSPGRGGRGCESPYVPYFSSYPGISTTVTNTGDPSNFAGDATTGCDWFDTKQIRGSGGNGCFVSAAFGCIAAKNPGPGGGGAVGCDATGNLIGCGGVLAGGSGCCGIGGYGGGAGYCGTPGNGLVVIYWNA